jgi:hypothetical protein
MNPEAQFYEAAAKIEACVTALREVVRLLTTSRISDAARAKYVAMKALEEIECAPNARTSS